MLHWQYNLKTGPLIGIGVTTQDSTMFFGNNLIANGHPQSSPLTNGLCCKKGFKDFLPDILWNPRTIITNSNPNLVMTWKELGLNRDSWIWYLIKICIQSINRVDQNIHKYLV